MTDVERERDEQVESEETEEERDAHGLEDEVDEAAADSFPSSDPPPW